MKLDKPSYLLGKHGSGGEETVGKAYMKLPDGTLVPVNFDENKTYYASSYYTSTGEQLTGFSEVKIDAKGIIDKPYVMDASGAIVPFVFSHFSDLEAAKTKAENYGNEEGKRLDGIKEFIVDLPVDTKLYNAAHEEVVIDENGTYLIPNYFTSDGRALEGLTGSITVDLPIGEAVDDEGNPVKFKTTGDYEAKDYTRADGKTLAGFDTVHVEGAYLRPFIQPIGPLANRWFDLVAGEAPWGIDEDRKPYDGFTHVAFHYTVGEPHDPITHEPVVFTETGDYDARNYLDVVKGQGWQPLSGFSTVHVEADGANLDDATFGHGPERYIFRPEAPYNGFSRVEHLVNNDKAYDRVVIGAAEYLRKDEHIFTENGTFKAADYFNRFTGHATELTDAPLEGITEFTINVQPELQEKTVVENGEVTPDEGFYGLSKVVVDTPVPQIVPVTVQENNKEYDAVDYGVDGFNKVTVALPMEQRTITRNGTYMPVGDNQGFSEVVVNVQGGGPAPTLGYYGYRMFDGDTTITEVDLDAIPWAPDGLADAQYMFRGCTNLVRVTGTAPSNFGLNMKPVFANSKKIQYLPDMREVPGPQLLNIGFSNYQSVTTPPFPKLRELMVVGPLSNTFYQGNSLPNVEVLHTKRFPYLNNAAMGRLTHIIVDATEANANNSSSIHLCGWANKNLSVYNPTKKVTDADSYAALKNDPDWWTNDRTYSRYNAATLIEDAANWPVISRAGTYTSQVIQVYGNQGENTDGGSFDNMTPEQIAILTSKNYTLTLS